MNALLRVSRSIDRLNHGIGHALRWLVLATVLISAGNALVRKAFDTSSNALLEIQWYLFATVFMGAAGWVFLKNAHVRIDFISARLSARANAVIDSLGIVLCALPLCVLMVDMSGPLFLRALHSGEMSQNAGGLVRWPVLLLMPLGFGLLGLQCVSELIKRVAFLRGHTLQPFTVDADPTDGPR